MNQDILTYEEYAAIHEQPLEAFLATLESIAQQCGLPRLEWQRQKVGRNLVFFLGSAFVVKLTPPFWWQLEERAALTLAYRKLPLETPELVAQGEIYFGGHVWSFLVQTQVAGSALYQQWRNLSESQQVRLAAAHGSLMRHLHAVQWSETFPEALWLDWRGLLSEQYQSLESALRHSVARPRLIHQISGAVPVSADWHVPERLISNTAAFLEPRLELVLGNSERLFLHGDLNPLNLLVNSELEICGIVDFSDSRVGPREHDLVSPIMNFYYRSEPVLESFLSAYGDKADRTQTFVRCILFYASEWAHRLGIMFGDAPPDAWDAVAERLHLL